jgi:hypothetical protein
MTTTWTTETIYKDPNCVYTTTPTLNSVRTSEDLFTEDFLAAVRSEKSPTFEPVPTIATADERAVGLRQIECPICYGTGTTLQYMRGNKTGVVLTRSVTCQCRSLHLFWPKWNLVDRRFKDANLTSVAPYAESSSPLEEQVQNIADIEAYPTSSFILQGAGSAGKTYLMHCLYRHRLAEWANHPNAAEGQSVWMYSAWDYLNSVSKHAQNPSSPAPKLTPELIRKRTNQGLPVAIFLDEVDKFAYNEGRVKSLFELVNTAYACQAQVVMTSNADVDTLAASWGADGGHLLRRVGVAPDGFTLDFTTDQKVGQ